MLGLMLIFVGFYFFLACCLVYLPDTGGLVNIYGAPATLAMLARSIPEPCWPWRRG